MKWKLYWTALLASLFSFSWFRNYRKYRQHRSKLWIAGKSLTDLGLAGGLAWLFPPLLIAFIVLWTLQFVKQDRIWQTVAGVVSGTVLAVISTFCLELFIVLGIVSADVVTSRMAQRWEELA